MISLVGTNLRRSRQFLPLERQSLRRQAAVNMPQGFLFSVSHLCMIVLTFPQKFKCLPTYFYYMKFLFSRTLRQSVQPSNEQISKCRNNRSCVNCGDPIPGSYWDRKTCSASCGQEMRVRLKITSAAYTNLVSWVAKTVIKEAIEKARKYLIVEGSVIEESDLW